MQGMQVLAGIILMLQAGPAAATGDDELWIERYMSQPGRSAQPVAMRRGYRIDWAELQRFVGVPVKVTTDTGRTHRGLIERADAREVLLRAQSHGGYANLTLRRDQVINTELE